jgi:tRNA nucleotidyltransferase/poly(A) polymerase
MALLCKRLKMSKDETKRLRAWADDPTVLSPELSERERMIAVYKSGKQTALDRTRLRAAGEPDTIRSARWMVLADLAMGWIPPEFPLSGKDLRAAGVEPGPKMGKALKALEALWIRSGFSADKEKLLIALKMLG